MYKISVKIANVEKELIKSYGQLGDARKRKREEERAIEEGKKLSKQSKTKEEVKKKAKKWK